VHIRSERRRVGEDFRQTGKGSATELINRYHKKRDKKDTMTIDGRNRRFPERVMTIKAVYRELGLAVK
jgi:hypothetical protein